MSDNEPCPRIGKLFGACKFTGRHDLSPADMSALGEVEGSAAAVYSMAQLTRAKTYVRDVCERCGKTVERA